MMNAHVLKWGALSIFVLQNAGVILLMKLSRNSPGVPYSTRVAVLAQEVVKLLICSALYAHETGGLMPAILAVRADVRDNAIEWLQLGIPAGLYTLQNNALFIGLSNLDAAVAHVTYQTKILFTAIFSVTLLGKRLGATQWSGLACLVLGVICVQGLLDKLLQAYSDPGRPSADATAVPLHPARSPASRSHAAHAAGRGLEAAPLSPEAAAASRTWLLGIGAMLSAALCTSFASVYFERMLKGDRKPSLWLRNIQLAIYCGAIATATVLAEDDPARASSGWLHGFTPLVWSVVALNVLGGLLVAVTIKYADNIIRGFAQAVSIIVGALGSHFLFGLVFTPTFVLGVVFVIAAILLYGGAVELPFAAGCCGSGDAARAGARASPDTSLDGAPDEFLDAPKTDDEEAGLLPLATGRDNSPLLKA